MKKYSAGFDDFSLDDFRKQFEQMHKMRDIIGRIPGMSDLIPEGEDPEQALRHIQGMVDSMTKEERRHPGIIDFNRCQRIARGSGTESHEVKKFLGEFDKLRALMRQLAKLSMWERIEKISGLGDIDLSSN